MEPSSFSAPGLVYIASYHSSAHMLFLLLAVHECLIINTALILHLMSLYFSGLTYLCLDIWMELVMKLQYISPTAGHPTVRKFNLWCQIYLSVRYGHYLGWPNLLQNRPVSWQQMFLSSI